MSQITHDMTINAKYATVFQALTTVEGLRAWFTSQTDGTGKVGTHWKLEFIDQPSFSWHILTVEKDRIVWKCLEGPGNSPGTEVEFSLKPQSEHQTILNICHRGWTHNDPKFESCVEIWRTLMNHLQRYCEEGIAQPVYI